MSDSVVASQKTLFAAAAATENFPQIGHRSSDKGPSCRPCIQPYSKKVRERDSE